TVVLAAATGLGDHLGDPHRGVMCSFPGGLAERSGCGKPGRAFWFRSRGPLQHLLSCPPGRIRLARADKAISKLFRDLHGPSGPFVQQPRPHGSDAGTGEEAALPLVDLAAAFEPLQQGKGVCRGEPVVLSHRVTPGLSEHRPASTLDSAAPAPADAPAPPR